MMAGITVFLVVSPIAIVSSYFGTSFLRTLRANQNGADESAPKASVRKDNVRSDGKANEIPRWQRRTQISLMSVTALLYIGEAAAFVTSPRPTPTTGSDENAIFALFSSLAWFMLLLCLSEVERHEQLTDFRIPWSLGVTSEVVLLVINLVDPFRDYQRAARTIQLATQTGRIFCFIALTCSTFINPAERRVPASDEERAPLLSDAENTQTTKSYTDEQVEEQDEAKKTDDDDEDDEEADMRKFRQNWVVYLKAFKVFLPYLWPKTLTSCLCLMGLGLAILAQRALNVALPLSLGLIVDSLTGSPGHMGKMPVAYVGLYVGLRLLDSQAGLGSLERILWVPIEQNARFRIKCAAYGHIMDLSHDYHSTKSHSRVWQSVQRGAEVIRLFKTVGIDLLPMIVDLALSLSILWYLFDAYMAFIVATVVLIFFWTTTKSLELKTRIHRSYIKTWEDEWHQTVESSSNWETVCQFGRIPYEQMRYATNVAAGQKVRFQHRLVNNLFDGLRDVTLLSGLLVGALLAAYQITQGEAKVGRFVVLISYWARMESPLADLAATINDVAEQLVDAEKLMALLKTVPTVQDKEGASEFVLKDGEVEFKADDDGNGVTFSYDNNRIVTQDVNFHVRPGETVALVGATGCGKSTLFKLLFRFYDTKAGQVLIDGQNVRDVTLDSFRDHIGVVPQEPILFNAPILENLRYARLDATDEEIHEACKAVALHDKVLSFTKGYHSKVGERGVKLSGGEKQRIAIARVMLKKPKILLLDEATSSVDSITEAAIQASLARLCANRTTFVIAHRLSTIVHADQVFVMDGGRIVETGTHREMIKRKGPYNRLWTSQLRSDVVEKREKSSSRSRSPTNGKGLGLINDLVAGEEDSTNLMQETIARDQEGQSDVHTASHENTTRGRSPAKNLINGIRRSLSQSSRTAELQGTNRVSSCLSAPDLAAKNGPNGTNPDVASVASGKSDKIREKKAVSVLPSSVKSVPDPTEQSPSRTHSPANSSKPKSPNPRPNPKYLSKKRAAVDPPSIHENDDITTPEARGPPSHETLSSTPTPPSKKLFNFAARRKQSATEPHMSSPAPATQVDGPDELGIFSRGASSMDHDNSDDVDPPMTVRRTVSAGPTMMHDCVDEEEMVDEDWEGEGKAETLEQDQDEDEGDDNHGFNGAAFL